MAMRVYQAADQSAESGMPVLLSHADVTHHDAPVPVTA